MVFSDNRSTIGPTKEKKEEAMSEPVKQDRLADIIHSRVFQLLLDVVLNRRQGESWVSQRNAIRGLLFNQEDEYRSQVEVLVKALIILVAVNLLIAFVFPIAVSLAIVLISIYPITSVFKQLNDLVWVKSHLEDSLI